MKRNISIITMIDIIMYVLVFGLITYAKIIGMRSYDSFYEVVKEDGIVEYLTTLFLFGCCIIFAVRTIRSFRLNNKKQLVFNLIILLVFIFGTGEEISWGQRLLNIESGNFFQQKNIQAETNLHNLEVGGVNLNILIFSQLMFVALAFYFIVLGILAWKSKMIRKLVIGFNVPLPKLHHVIVILAQTFLILSIDLVKESELHELSLAGILFLIFLSPASTIRGVAVRE